MLRSNRAFQPVAIDSDCSEGDGGSHSFGLVLTLAATFDCFEPCARCVRDFVRQGGGLFQQLHHRAAGMRLTGLANDFASAANKVGQLFLRTTAVSGYEDFAVVRSLVGHQGFVRSVCVTSDGQRALSGSWDKTAILWDMDSGQILRTFSGHRDYVTSVSLSQDSSLALSGSWDKTLILWDVASGQPIRELKGHKDHVLSVAISPDGEGALSGSRDGIVMLWNLKNRKLVECLQEFPRTQSV